MRILAYYDENEFQTDNPFARNKVEEDPILDDVEKEYLGNIIKPFKKKYRKMKISKYGLKDTDVCYIRIILEIKGKADECQEEIDLPYFRYDTMYKGMEIDRKYTLEELGL